MPMGACQSLKPGFGKDTESCEGWGWTGPAGTHSPFPIDCVKYPGDGLLYCFLDFMTSFEVMKNTVNLGPRVVTTNVEKYTQELEDCYSQGFILSHFVKVPSLSSTIELQNYGIKHPFQAILSKPQHSNINHAEIWGLKIHKRVINTNMKLQICDCTGEGDLAKSINEIAEDGSRLLCVQPIGFIQPASTNKQYAVIGMDLICQVPRQPTFIHYFYHTIVVPIQYRVDLDPSLLVHQVTCETDWKGYLKYFLDKGWKLVDVCFDRTHLTEVFQMKSAGEKVVDTTWILEKEMDKLKETHPRYEGVVIEYLHKTKDTPYGEIPCKDWRPVIAGMGVSGWELTTIVQTPILAKSTMHSTMNNFKLLMFFQRKINKEHYVATQNLLAEKRKQEELDRLNDRRGLKKIHGAEGWNQNGQPIPKFMNSNGGIANHRAKSIEEEELVYNPVLKRYVPLRQSSVANGYSSGSMPRGYPHGDIR